MAAHARLAQGSSWADPGAREGLNQLDVFPRGDATAATFVRTALNFCVPFVVSNLGLLAGKW